MKKLQIFSKLVLVSILVSVFVMPVMARIAGPSEEIEDIPRDEQLISTIVSTILWLTIYAFALSVLFIVVAGIMYVVSAGQTEQIEHAKRILTYAITGLVISLIAYFLVLAISGIVFGDIVGGVFGIFG
ncbi:DUF1624 domain-containing protein [Patescibacteria group bacterium]|nr:MAG: DUF1624 domain-containing protein [Patescibacteria group bacterium]